MNQTRKIQLLGLEILKTIHKICKENKLTYYMVCGNILGAIRHKGFIAWDDDIDLAMPRPDYEIFIKRAGELLPNRYRLSEKFYSSSYPCYHVKVYDTQTTVVEDAKAGSIIGGVSVDIFPLDGLGNNSAIFKKVIKKIRSKEQLIDLTENKSRANLSLVSRFKLFIFKNIFLYRFADKQKMLKNLDKYARRFDYNESVYVGALMCDPDTKECMPKSVFGKPTLYDFEGEKFYGPENYDKYLRTKYGDYMILPDKENQKSSHKFIYVNLKLPYEEYIISNNFSNQKSLVI
jgi:lipopolysaccharide cholinephosphotransferase